MSEFRGYTTFRNNNSETLLDVSGVGFSQRLPGGCISPRSAAHSRFYPLELADKLVVEWRVGSGDLNRVTLDIPREVQEARTGKILFEYSDGEWVLSFDPVGS